MNILIGKTTLNFNEIVAYLLEVESLNKPQESSFLSDQALTISARVGKVIIMGRRKARARDNLHATYVTRRVT